MTITWLGHACFLLEERGYRIVIDPYDGVAGYPPLHTEAHGIYCSHGHFDHCFRAGVSLLPGRESPFSVEEIASFHDGCRGAKRGANTIRIFSAGGQRVCHLGDLGHPLSEAQAAAIGCTDVLLLPVGGVYTIGPAEAAAAAAQLRPRCAVPMHYRHGPYGLAEVGGAEEFLRLFSPGEITCLPGRSFSVSDAPLGILLPAWTAEAPSPAGD